MQTESSANYFYRYKIETDNDLSDETVARRLRKIGYSSAERVLFDWTDNLNFNQALLTQSETITTLPKAHLITISQAQSHSIFFQNKSANDLHIQVKNSDEVFALDKYLNTSGSKKSFISLHLAPLQKVDLFSFQHDFNHVKFKFQCYFWNFKSYNKYLKNSLTTEDIGRFFSEAKNLSFFKLFSSGYLDKLEIWNDLIPAHYELEADNYTSWQFSIPAAPSIDIKISVVIPSFNNCLFLVNVLRHLLDQDTPKNYYEIIIIEDGGSDNTSETLKLLLQNNQHHVNLRFIYWSKNHPQKGPQNFFRAGLARNLGVRYAQAEHIVFLDSDILVPNDFISVCLSELAKSDLIQFQRFHIQQRHSLQNPSYHAIHRDLHTYIEEKRYWSQLFFCQSWDQLENHWKYTCTYALGIKKSDFLKCGRFKKYYVSYGFEDTDLGYEMHRLNKRFKLIARPLYHLTAYDKMQYQNSQAQRLNLLKKTARLFFRQHLDLNIFLTLRNFYRFEKSLFKNLTDLL